MLRAGNRACKAGVYLRKFITFHNGGRSVLKKEEDFADLRLCLPPVGVCGKPHTLTGVEFRNNIRPGSGRIVCGDISLRNYREGHLKQETVIRPLGFDDNRIIVLRGNAVNKKTQVLVKPVVSNRFIFYSCKYIFS